MSAGPGVWRRLIGSIKTAAARNIEPGCGELTVGLPCPPSAFDGAGRTRRARSVTSKGNDPYEENARTTSVPVGRSRRTADRFRRKRLCGLASEAGVRYARRLLLCGDEAAEG